MKEAISSPQILDKIKGIGERNDLMIDQIGGLVEQVCLVMLGLAKASDFVKNTTARLGIDERKARVIASSINMDVFESLKQVLRNSEENTARESSMASVGQAGGFEIEHDIPGNGEKGEEKASAEAASMSETDKANMLSDIENPRPTAGRIQPGDRMVDQLLHAPAAIPEEKIVRKVQPPDNLPTDDPYREPIK